MADEKTYTQEQLDAAITKATGDVEGLKGKVDELIGDNKKLKAELRKTQDIKPEDVAALESELEAARSKLTEATKAATDATKARDKAVKDLEAETGFTQKLLISDGLKSALLANGVKDEDFIDSLTAKFASSASIVVEGDQRKAMLGDKAMADAIKEWAGSDAGKKFVSAPANSGGDAGGGGRTNSGAKTLTRVAFEAMDHGARSAFAKDGGTVVDAAA